METKGWMLPAPNWEPTSERAKRVPKVQVEGELRSSLPFQFLLTPYSWAVLSTKNTMGWMVLSWVAVPKGNYLMDWCSAGGRFLITSFRVPSLVGPNQYFYQWLTPGGQTGIQHEFTWLELYKKQKWNRLPWGAMSSPALHRSKQRLGNYGDNTLGSK